MELTSVEAYWAMKMIVKSLPKHYKKYIKEIVNETMSDEVPEEIKYFRQKADMKIEDVKKNLSDYHSKFLLMVKKPDYIRKCIENINILYAVSFPKLAKSRSVDFQIASSEEILLKVIITVFANIYERGYLVNTKDARGVKMSLEAIMLKRHELLNVIIDSIKEGIKDSIAETFITNMSNERLADMKQIHFDDTDITIPEWKLSELINSNKEQYKVVPPEVISRENYQNINRNGPTEEPKKPWLPKDVWLRQKMMNNGQRPMMNTNTNTNPINMNMNNQQPINQPPINNIPNSNQQPNNIPNNNTPIAPPIAPPIINNPVVNTTDDDYDSSDENDFTNPYTNKK